MRNTFSRGITVACAAALVTGCTSGNSAIEPAFQSANLSTIGKLQFAVGTANLANADGTGSLVGLNTVVTFRNAKGGSAVAVDSPSIVGPPSFLVPTTTSDAGVDAGTNTITSTTQPTTNSGTEAATTFGTLGSATLYGFGPNNYDTTGTPHYGTYPLPVYNDVLDTALTTYVPQSFDGLPPAFPAPPPGTGFTGYNLGFVPFAAKAVSGTYTLNVLLPTSAGSSQASYTYSASATLNAARVLPTLAPPVLTLDSSGTGGSLSVVFPAGVIEVVVELADVTAGGESTYVFTQAASGAQTVTDGTIGASTDEYIISAIGCDYDAFADAAPANTSQLPAIVGPAGQDDITMAMPQDIAAASGSSTRRQGRRFVNVRTTPFRRSMR